MGWGPIPRFRIEKAESGLPYAHPKRPLQAAAGYENHASFACPYIHTYQLANIEDLSTAPKQTTAAVFSVDSWEYSREDAEF